MNNAASYERILGAMRKMAPGTMGGQSRVASPPSPSGLRQSAVLLGGFYSINALAQSVADHPPIGFTWFGIDLDETSIVQRGDRDIAVVLGFHISLPSGHYLGATGNVDFGTLGLNSATLDVQVGFSSVLTDSATGTATSFSLSLPAFDIPPGGGFLVIAYNTEVVGQTILATSAMSTRW